MLAACSEIPVTEGIEVTAHKVNLAMGTQHQQVGKVDSARTASGASHGMINMHYHQAINALTTLPYLLVCGGVAKVDLEHHVPDSLVLASTVVDKLPNGGAIVRHANTKPVVVLI